MLSSSSALATRKNNHRNTIFNLSCSRPLGDFRHNTNNEVTMKVSVIITIIFLQFGCHPTADRKYPQLWPFTTVMFVTILAQNESHFA